MPEKSSIDTDYYEIKNVKLILFEFFLNVNQYRSLKKFNAVLLVTISFLQLFFMLNQLLVIESLSQNSIYSFVNGKSPLTNGSLTNSSSSNTSSLNSSITNASTNQTKNSTANSETTGSLLRFRFLTSTANSSITTTTTVATTTTTTSNSANTATWDTSSVDPALAKLDPYYFVDPNSDFGKSLQIVVFDPINIGFKASFIIPLLEFQLNIFGEFYTILFIFVYVFTGTLIISIAYSLIKLCKGKEVYFKFSLELISTSFLFIQWIFYLPILYILLYPFFGRLQMLLPDYFNSVGLKTVNIVLVAFYIIINFAISVLNNDSISRYDNSLCRKDTNLEALLFILRTLLFFTLIFVVPLAINVIVSIISCILVGYLINNLYQNKIFYDDQIGKIFGAFLLCFIQKFIGGIIVVFSKVFIIDYSFTLIVSFIINLYIFEFFYNKMKCIILKKKLSELKSVEEVLLYLEMLEKEMMKTLIGDPVSCSMMAGYILNHKNNCYKASCPLLAKELYHPLTDSKLEITSNKIQDLYKSEIVLIHLLKEVFVTLCEKFNGKGRFHFAYSVFLLFRLGNNKLALIEIENSSNYDNTLQEEYSFYLLKHNTNESLINNKNFLSNDYTKLSISILDIMDVIVFDQLSQDLQVGMFDCSKLKIEFWSTLKQTKVLVEDLYKKGNEYINKKNYVAKLWKKMILITTNNRKIIELYVRYLDNICDDTSNPIQENKRAHSTGEIDHNDVVMTRFNDDTGFIIINLSLGPLIGNIHYYNKAINKILNYSSDYLYGKNINIIMPNAIGEVHNQILTNFVHSGKTNIIGKTSDVHAKDKDQFLRPIALFIMPLPSYNGKSEVIGLIKERSTTSLYMICNQYGEVDSFSKDFFLHNESFDPLLLSKLDINLFVFFMFPELLQPNSDKKPRLFFSDRNESTFSINAFFDPYLIAILSETDISKKKKDMKVNIQKKKKDKLTKDLKYLKQNFPNETNTRIKMYYNFSNICFKIKEFLMTENPEDFSIDYIQDYKEFMYYMETITKDNYVPEDNMQERFLSQFHIRKVVKKVFNLKVTPHKFFVSNGQDTKLFILELTIPPTDMDNESEHSKEKHLSNENLDEDNQQANNNNNEKDNNAQNDDIGSVSSVSTTNVNSIQNIVNKIRDESYGADNLNKSSQVNICLLMIMGIILGFLIFYVYYIVQYTKQQNTEAQLIRSEFYMKRGIFDFRDITEIKDLQQRIAYGTPQEHSLTNFPQPKYNTDEMNLKLIEVCLTMLNLQKNMSYLMIDMTDKATVEEINMFKYSLDDGSTLYHNDILDMLLYDSIFISRPKRFKNENSIDKLFSSLGITAESFSYTNNSQVIYSHITSFIDLSKNSVQNSTSRVIDTLIGDLKQENDKIEFILYVAFIIIACITICLTIVIFLILQKRYELNKSILELLNEIKIEDINEILFNVEQFMNELKLLNYNLENKIIQNLETKEDVEDVDNVDVNTQLIDSSSKSNNGSASSSQVTTASTTGNSISGGSGFLNSSSNSKQPKKGKNIRRRESIMVSFLINILIMYSIVGIFLFLLNYFSDYSIASYNLVFNYMIDVFNSFSQNQKILSNIKDVFIYNDNVMYDSQHKVSEYFYFNFNLSKFNNEKVFRGYSENKTKFSASLINDFDLLYFGDLCSAQTQALVQVFCNASDGAYNSSSVAAVTSSSNNNNNNASAAPSVNSTSTSTSHTLNGTVTFDLITISNTDFPYASTKTSILNKGFKYLVDYYSNSIESLISIYQASYENNLYLPAVFLSRFNDFYLPTYLIFNELRLIFDKISTDLLGAYFIVSNLFILLVALISGLFLLTEFVVIIIKWRKYINQIKLEEYMSNKIIAEIPMHLIRNNKGICNHLLDYSNKNS